MKKWVKVALVAFIVQILSISALIGMIYESPLSIFLSSEDSEDDRTGYEIVAEEVLKYYLDLETIVKNKEKEDEDTAITNKCSKNNMADVIAIYASIAASNEKSNPCDFKTPEVAQKNRNTLKTVFDKMNTYSQELEEKQRSDGEKIGDYCVTFNDDSLYLNADEVYGECMVSNEDLGKIPVNSVISINGLQYRVMGGLPELDKNTISICKASSETSPFNGEVYAVLFVSTPEVPTITYIVTKLTYHNYDAEYYIETYGLTRKQKEYFDEIEDSIAEIAKTAEEIAGSSSSNTSTDLGDVEPIKPNESQKEFIDSIGKAAIKYYPQYRILPSLTIAQAINESGWGKSGLAVYHNYFGMKYSDGCGTAFITKSTQEQSANGSYTTINAKFRAYQSREDGIKGYYDFLQYPRYRNLCGVTDYKVATTLIKTDGWATSLSYTENLQKLIVQYNLTDYDRAAGAIAFAPSQNAGCSFIKVSFNDLYLYNERQLFAQLEISRKGDEEYA